MAKSNNATIIKKYANRRLYNTGTSTYVTLENLAAMIKSEEDFVVHDAKTGDDITHAILTQIIFEQENKNGQNLFPTSFLRQMVRCYGDPLQALVPAFLEASMETFSREHENLRHRASKAPTRTWEEQTRRTVEPFRESAYGAYPGEAAPRRSTNVEDLASMRTQLAEMQRRLEAMDHKRAG